MTHRKLVDFETKGRYASVAACVCECEWFVVDKVGNSNTINNMNKIQLSKWTPQI